MGDFGNTAEIWTAIFTAFLVLATAALAVIALMQIRAAREENRGTQTLVACGNYDLNEVIFSSHRTLLKAKDEGRLLTDARALRLEITNILNFLDAIAIGIDQKLYVEDLAYNHLHAIVAKHIRELIDSGVAEKAGCSKENYATLLTLNGRWSERNRNSPCPVPIPEFDTVANDEEPPIAVEAIPS